MPLRHVNPDGLPSNPAYTQAVRVPAGYATVHIGGQNGVGPNGELIGPGLAEQARQALANVGACLEAAGADVADVVKWTILCVDGAPLAEGFCAFQEFWPQDAPPPAITVAVVAGLAVEGAMIEIEAVAAVPDREG
jgi:enamine deaminase RidA (YjgF/YER057c/UK114 family)